MCQWGKRGTSSPDTREGRERERETDHPVPRMSLCLKEGREEHLHPRRRPCSVVKRSCSWQTMMSCFSKRCLCREEEDELLWEQRGHGSLVAADTGVCSSWTCFMCRLSEEEHDTCLSQTGHWCRGTSSSMSFSPSSPSCEQTDVKGVDSPHFSSRRSKNFP